MGWDNTNFSSDVQLVNMMNSLKINNPAVNNNFSYNVQEIPP